MAVYFGDGIVRAPSRGSFTATATAGSGFGAPPVTLDIPVTITWPTLTADRGQRAPGRLYTGVSIAALRPRASTVMAQSGRDSSRRGAAPTRAIARVDRFGNVSALKPGTVTITAEAEGVRGEKRYVVAANPVTSIDLAIKEVVGPNGRCRSPERDRPSGRTAPRSMTRHHLELHVYAGRQHRRTGRRRASSTRRLTAGSSPATIRAGTRSWRSPARVRGEGARGDAARCTPAHHRHGARHHQHSHTSDLWPFTGKDGRDYCLVGTWGADGYAIDVRHHGHEQYREDGLGAGGRAHDQRRDRVAGRALRRADARRARPTASTAS